MTVWFIAMFAGKQEPARSEQRVSQVEIDATRLQACWKKWLACIIYPSFIKCHWDALHFISSLAVIPVKQVCHLSWCQLKKTVVFKLIRNCNMYGKCEHRFLKDEPWYLHFKFMNLKTLHQLYFYCQRYLLVRQPFVFCSFSCRSKLSAAFSGSIFCCCQTTSK